MLSLTSDGHRLERALWKGIVRAERVVGIVASFWVRRNSLSTSNRSLQVTVASPFPHQMPVPPTVSLQARKPCSERVSRTPVPPMIAIASFTKETMQTIVRPLSFFLCLL
ncbi:unnamed protein product [Victoria cruziana]